MNVTWPVTVVGCHYHAGVAGVHAGMDLVLVREPLNPHDKKAVRVQTLSGTSLGHLSRADASRVAPVLDQGIPVKAVVESTIIKPARLNLHITFDDHRLHPQPSPAVNKPSGCLPIVVCTVIVIGIVWLFLRSI
jgi:hypothetical protein